ncbi:MAG TPA: putative Na+/H+ antiporter [Planctomycetota bacterium]|nr:putative Na+/H+ antiporter [Planctomycetota bacterium]
MKAARFISVFALFLGGSAAAAEHAQASTATTNSTLQHIATALFALAVLHTFLVGRFRAWAHRYPSGSKMENLLHLLGEVEAVFVMWAAALFAAIASFDSWHSAVAYIESRDYTEPKFVFAIMAIAATRPVIDVVDAAIRSCGWLLQRISPLGETGSFLLSALVVGPLLGSFVTEPAAMTVTALVLKRQLFDRGMSKALMYGVLGALFVNVSIGGVLTNFAAPPVLMVARTWSWTNEYMLLHFGWKAVVAVVFNAAALTLLFRRELAAIPLRADSDRHDHGLGRRAVPWWVILVHLLALAFVVLTSHHSDVFFGGFVLFLGFCAVTREYQEPLKLKDSLLVGGFLAGLVTLGGLQDWWLRPLLASLGEFPLYVGCTALTAVTDNAALTYLGSQVPGLTDGMKYALVAGAVTGGGLTVIANAPNPAGYSVLNPTFEKRFSSGISPLWLFIGALPPTAVAFVCFWFLP